MGPSCPRRRTTPPRPPWGSALLLAVLLTAGGCEGVKETALESSARLDRLFGTDQDGQAKGESQWRDPAPAPPSAAERSYRAGLSEKHAGRREAAAARFREAADQGHPAAMTELGRAYGEGLGVPKDQATAARYLGQAAVKGDAEGQYLLGEAFANGQGVPRDTAWAARWYAKAARQGQADAQYAYGVLLAAGKGVPQDQVAGYGWVALAERQGHAKAAELRPSLAKSLDADRLAAAEARAAAFTPRRNTRFADPPTVAYLQDKLNRLGYDAGRADGLMGPRTRGAIRAYQKDAGLAADGRLTPGLLEAVFARGKG
ncbi:MAG: SEL1-like repeat protein [Rhodospirillales bacterium]|nr:SEL1-like repeat protein [Rhodospirillales bacterium]